MIIPSLGGHLCRRLAIVPRHPRLHSKTVSNANILKTKLGLLKMVRDWQNECVTLNILHYTKKQAFELAGA